MKKPPMVFGKIVDHQTAYRNFMKALEAAELAKEKKEKQYLLRRLETLLEGRQIVLVNLSSKKP